MSNDDHVLVERREHVLWVTLNRPDSRNAISPEAVCRLADAWQLAATDPSVRVAVLTGNGAAFSAGADLKLLIPLLSRQRQPTDDWDQRVLADPDMAGRAFCHTSSPSFPLIAAVNGVATGGGLELMLAATLRIASDTARFGLSEVKRGLIPGGGGLARLPRQIPPALAAEVLITGDLFDSDWAARAGLINRVVPAAELLDAAQTLADTIAGNGPLAVQLILDAIRASESAPYETAVEIEKTAFQTAVASEDAAEGISAFAAKRTPVYFGH